MSLPPTGIDRNLTHYADPGLSRYLTPRFSRVGWLRRGGFRVPRSRHRRHLVRLHHLPSHHVPTRRSRQTKRNSFVQIPYGCYGPCVGWLYKRPFPERPCIGVFVSPHGVVSIIFLFIQQGL